jgi:hypothetical protein
VKFTQKLARVLSSFIANVKFGASATEFTQKMAQAMSSFIAWTNTYQVVESSFNATTIMCIQCGG